MGESLLENLLSHLDLLSLLFLFEAGNSQEEEEKKEGYQDSICIFGFSGVRFSAELSS